MLHQVSRSCLGMMCAASMIAAHENGIHEHDHVVEATVQVDDIAARVNSHLEKTERTLDDMELQSSVLYVMRSDPASGREIWSRLADLGHQLEEGSLDDEGIGDLQAVLSAVLNRGHDHLDGHVDVSEHLVDHVWASQPTEHFHEVLATCVRHPTMFGRDTARTALAELLQNAPAAGLTSEAMLAAISNDSNRNWLRVIGVDHVPMMVLDEVRASASRAISECREPPLAELSILAVGHDVVPTEEWTAINGLADGPCQQLLTDEVQEIIRILTNDSVEQVKQQVAALPWTDVHLKILGMRHLRALGVSLDALDAMLQSLEVAQRAELEQAFAHLDQERRTVVVDTTLDRQLTPLRTALMMLNRGALDPEHRGG